MAELREAIRYAPLAHFFDEILPLARELEQKAAQTQVMSPIDAALLSLLPADDRLPGQEAAAKEEMSLMASQLWGLLSSYCFLPTDLPAVFPNHAKLLGSILTESGGTPENRRSVPPPFSRFFILPLTVDGPVGATIVAAHYHLSHLCYAGGV